MKTPDVRTFLRTNRVTGPPVTWAWWQYLTALANTLPNDCAGIPNVPGAGRVFSGGAEACREHLADRGFVIVAEHSRRESFTTDGLIVARAAEFPRPRRVPISLNTSRNAPLVMAKYLLQKLGVLRKTAAKT